MVYGLRFIKCYWDILAYHCMICIICIVMLALWGKSSLPNEIMVEMAILFSRKVMKGRDGREKRWITAAYRQRKSAM